jgi:putative ABC transport system ATP-binding protein
MFGTSEVTGISGVDLEIDAGQLVLIKGDSGSGKSTLLSLLAGLDKPTTGRLTVANHDLMNASERRLTHFRRQVIGMVFQNFNLLPTLNVIENACLPALLAGSTYQTAEPKAAQLLRWLKMEHRLSHLPSQLSGGEMQRTAIARALINDPSIIIADEPTGNLDSRNGETVIRLLAELNSRWQRTVIIATHSSLADKVADVSIRLKDGHIAERF